ncbi:MAG: Ig-like domain-containing protein [Candidatus Omnitrophota bacterium]
MTKKKFFNLIILTGLIVSFLISSASASPLPPPKTAVITGTVVDKATLKPIGYATVSASAYRRTFKTQTDAQGRYALKIDISYPTFLIIRGYRDGYLPAARIIRLYPGKAYEVNFKLKDIRAPVIDSLSIEGGSSYTSKSQVTLILNAYDNESGLYQMSFSNDGRIWSPKEAYNSTKIWALTEGDGLKTVYAKVRDKAKHWSKPASSSITLDTTPPPTLQVTDDGVYTTLIDRLHAIWTPSLDQESGIKEYQYAIGTIPGGIDIVNWTSTGLNTELTHTGLSLTEGQAYYISIKAINNANLSSVGYSDGIIVDSVAPVVKITSPSNGYISYTQTITVSGTIDDNQATVTVNGIQAQVSNGTFTASGIILNVGQNTITATATDLAGNSSQDSITVTYQPSTTLLIDITSPIDGARVNTSTITVSGTISDNAAQVTVNGISTSVSNYTFTASEIPLTEGTNVITARATKDTQTVEDKINVILDQDPPSISIFIPDKDSTTRSNIVYGRVSDDTLEVTVNGIQAEIIENSRFIARPTLQEGPNTITVEATDIAGNISQSSINITYNTTVPKVVITSPLDNSEIDISPIKVEGTTTSDLQFIIVNSSTAIIDNTNFIAEGITLDSIKTVITASGYDENNNIFSDSIVINSPNLAHYELQKVSGDTEESDPNRPQAGQEHTLKVKLEKNYSLAPGEGVQFKVIEGNGALSNPYSFTDINGEAQVTLTLDTNSDITNQVETYPTNNPLVKITFYVDTKPSAPAILTKITDENITPVPGATIDLIVKLTDQYNNPIQDEQINFQVISGDGTLSSPTSTTNYYGEAKVNLTCPNVGLVLTKIQASSNTNPSVTATFNITTSAPLAITVDDIINKVNSNDSKIQDIKADITVTSNAPFLPPTMQLKIWQKGEKQKVEEIYPESKVYIRPAPIASGEFISMGKEIVTYDAITQTYILKLKRVGQMEEYPYELNYVDYNKGIIYKVEHIMKNGDYEFRFIREASNFIQLNDAWIFQKIVEITYDGQSKERYRTESIYTNIQVNTGIPDS